MTAPFPDPQMMPPEAPLAMQVQNLRAAPSPAALPVDGAGVRLARAFVFGFGLLVAGLLGWVMHDWFKMDGITPVEGGIVGLGAFTAFWIALSVPSAVLGCLPNRRARRTGGALDVAVILPIYGEALAPIVRNASGLLRALAAAGTGHRFTLYVLSDTRDPARVMAEQRALARVMATSPGIDLFYRHRAENTRFKAGNIADWVTRWGAAHEAMLMLDADSVMDAATVVAMADEMAASPRMGLVQSVPQLLGARTLFARIQAFANTVYGSTLARGLGLWSGTAANYWGHNALIRVRAFADAAGLPDLPGRRPFGGVILSHDFVEAALLRRGGWQVSFLPDTGGSFEGTPPTLVAHAMRDRRWCQGNLQHLRLLTARGLHPLSRMHMAQGAMAYVMSLCWFALIVFWVLVGAGADEGSVRYFTDANPIFPVWPEMDAVSKLAIVVLIYGMLVAPKVIGALAFWARDWRLRSAGGPVVFLASFVLEIVISVLMAPIMMVQHMVAVLRTLAGFDTGWSPSDPNARPNVLTLLRFHAVEVVMGAAVCALFANGFLTLWLLPIGVSLVLAPVLSWSLSSAPGWGQRIFVTPQDGSDSVGEVGVRATV